MPQKTPEEWAQIKVDYEAGELTQKALAEKWDISQAAITTHRNKEGWINPRTGKAWAPTPKQKAETETVPDGEAAAQLNKDQIDAALADIKASIEEPDEVAALKAQVAELQTRLKPFEPDDHSWPFTADAAARILADDLNDMVQMELNNLNSDRLKRGLPHFTVADMDRERPGWSDSIKDRIILETVEDLTAAATNSGPSIHKIDMKAPDGRVDQIPTDAGIDGGNRPAKLRARGWKFVKPQTCRRWNCYGEIPSGDPYEGFHSALHYELFQAQYPPTSKTMTTSETFDAATF